MTCRLSLERCTGVGQTEEWQVREDDVCRGDSVSQSSVLGWNCVSVDCGGGHMNQPVVERQRMNHTHTDTHVLPLSTVGLISKTKTQSLGNYRPSAVLCPCSTWLPQFKHICAD